MDDSAWRWVSCSIREFGPVGDQRHLARGGALVTYCGHSASYPDIWRRDRRKPKCRTCAKAEGKLLGTTKPRGRVADRSRRA